MSKATKIALIMAGGTGGHIFPAQAVATLLAAEGWTIHWLGTADRMEARLVPSFGWQFHPIQGLPAPRPCAAATPQRRHAACDLAHRA